MHGLQLFIRYVEISADYDQGVHGVGGGVEQVSLDVGGDDVHITCRYILVVHIPQNDRLRPRLCSEVNA